MPRNVQKHKLSRFTVFHRSLQNREIKWPYKPRLEIPYSDIVQEYNPNCKFIMYNS